MRSRGRGNCWADAASRALSPPLFPPLLLVAHSARRLAASAARAGLVVRAIDRFGDRDTRRLVPGLAVLPGRAGGALGFDRVELLRTAARVAPPAAWPALVVGTGFEDDVESMRLLASGRELFGNAPDLVAHLKSPVALARLLAELRIAHPQFALDPPADPAGWLSKRVGSSGGLDVHDMRDAATAPQGPGAVYFQRKVAGRPASALFAADGRRALLLGVSEQYVRSTGAHPYLFAGAAGPLALAPSALSALQRLLDRLVTATGLRGCNSVDFVLDGAGSFVVLEINPRPSATWDLYDADWPRGLLDVHLRACRGELPPQPAARAGARAFTFAFADREVAFDAAYRWPAWCSDLPDPACAPLQALAPICTVHGEGIDAASAWRHACVRLASIESSLEVLH
jgi:predicted ATP-grasp superfamily ATP-dependent carboligase